MVWGDFEEGRNKTLGDSLLRYQKRFLGLIEGKKGMFHSDPIFSKLGILKVSDMYKQQLRTHAWKFVKGRLPENQMSMLSKVSEVHGYGTRSAKTGMFMSTLDHRGVGYRVPKEWQSLPEKLKEMRSLQGFKKVSKSGFLDSYKSFQCKNLNCQVCAWEAQGRNADEHGHG